MLYSRRSLDKSLWGAIDTLSHYLVNFGETYLEIVDKDDENKTGIADKKLEFLPLGKVIKLFGNYIQVVPASFMLYRPTRFGIYHYHES